MRHYALTQPEMPSFTSPFLVACPGLPCAEGLPALPSLMQPWSKGPTITLTWINSLKPWRALQRPLATRPARTRASARAKPARRLVSRFPRLLERGRYAALVAVLRQRRRARQTCGRLAEGRHPPQGKAALQSRLAFAERAVLIRRPVTAS
jgi:hypothetical protein